MKKLLSVLFIGVGLLTLAACGNNDENAASDNNQNSVAANDNLTEKFGKSLVVYFSQPETTDPNNLTTEEENSAIIVDDEVLGNVQYVGMQIQDQTEADIFRIEPETPYTTDHDALTEFASEEQSNNARPTLKESVENLDEYDTIFFGYPNWWGDMPMIMYSFLEEHDLAGKTVIPSNVHGGSGLSDTVNSINEEAPDATIVTDALTISRDDVDGSEGDVTDWLNNLPETSN